MSTVSFNKQNEHHSTKEDINSCFPNNSFATTLNESKVNQMERAHDTQYVAHKQFASYSHNYVLRDKQLFSLLLTEIEAHRGLREYLKLHKDVQAEVVHILLKMLQPIFVEDLCKYSKLQLLFSYVFIYTLKEIIPFQMWVQLKDFLAKELQFLLRFDALNDLDALLSSFTSIVNTDGSAWIAEQLYHLLHSKNFFCHHMGDFCEHFHLTSKFDINACQQLAQDFHQDFAIEQQHTPVQIQSFATDQLPQNLSLTQCRLLCQSHNQQEQKKLLYNFYSFPFHLYECLMPFLHTIKTNEIRLALLQLQVFQESQHKKRQDFREYLEFLPTSPRHCANLSMATLFNLFHNKAYTLPVIQMKEAPALLDFYETWQSHNSQCKDNNETNIRFGKSLSTLQQQRQAAVFQRHEAILKEDKLFDPLNIDTLPNLNPERYGKNTATGQACYLGPYPISSKVVELPLDQGEVYKKSDLGKEHKRDPRLECSLLDAFYELQHHMQDLHQHICPFPTLLEEKKPSSTTCFI